MSLVKEITNMLYSMAGPGEINGVRSNVEQFQRVSLKSLSTLFEYVKKQKFESSHEFLVWEFKRITYKKHFLTV